MFEDLEEDLSTKVKEPKRKQKEKAMDSVTVQGDVYWANLNEPNAMSGKYQFDLCNLSAKAVDALEAMGIDVKHQPEKKADQGYFITLKSAKYPIKLFGNDSQPIDSSIQVGNGTVIRAKVGFYDWKSPMGQKGRSPKLLANKVLELREYLPSDEDGELSGALSDDEEAL